MKLTNGVHHVGLSVPQLHAAQTFFTHTLGYDIVGENPDYPSVFLSDGQTMITLWETKSKDQSHPFDRHHNIGLHHLALSISNRENLNTLYSKLQAAPDIKIEFAPEPLNGTPFWHMMCYIPGGIRLELITQE